MTSAPPGCPNPDCAHSVRLRGPRPPVRDGRPFFRRKGCFRRAGERSVARFQCRACGRHFSEQTFAPDYREKKPELTAAVERLARRGYSARSAARLLGVSRAAVTRRYRRYLARKRLGGHA